MNTVARPPIQSLATTTYPVKVLQFGTGNFLRGFADWMIQKANDSIGLKMGIAVVQSFGKDDRLEQQAGQYTVVERSEVNGKLTSTYQRVSVIQRTYHSAHDWEKIKKEACLPMLQFILSNTTESGLVFREEAYLENVPASTFPGKLTQLLLERSKIYPELRVAVIPCELVEKNGALLRKIVQDYASHWKLDHSFLTYLRERVSFCNTLVDRIVPGVPKEVDAHWEKLGYRDELITQCEPYHLWVIEAPGWVQQALPLQRAGLNVVYTDHLEPYRVRKVRILNGAHSLMAPLGYLAGLRTVQDAMGHPVIGKFVQEAIQLEVSPFIPGPPDVIAQYVNDTFKRFSNPAIPHELFAITLNSISKYRVRLVPSVQAYIASKQFIPERLAFAFAALFFFYRGLKGGREIEIKDDPRIIQYFRSRWQSTPYTPEGMQQLVADLLSLVEWWGIDLSEHHYFAERIGHYLYQIDQIGILDGIRELKREI